MSNKSKEEDNNMRKDLFVLVNKSNVLKNIRLITNECLSNGAYSSKNEIEQLMKLNKVNTPQWETDIIGKAITFKRKLAHNTLRDLDLFLEKYKDLV